MHPGTKDPKTCTFIKISNFILFLRLQYFFYNIRSTVWVTTYLNTAVGYYQPAGSTNAHPRSTRWMTNVHFLVGALQFSSLLLHPDHPNFYTQWVLDAFPVWGKVKRAWCCSTLLHPGSMSRQPHKSTGLCPLSKVYLVHTVFKELVLLPFLYWHTSVMILIFEISLHWSISKEWKIPVF
jgi:hypothetical protein